MVVRRRPDSKDDILSWMVLPPSIVRFSMTSSTLLEKLETPPLFLWRLFTKEQQDQEGPWMMDDDKDKEFWKKQWPQTQTLHGLKKGVSKEVLLMLQRLPPSEVKIPPQAKRNSPAKHVPFADTLVTPLLGDQASVVEQFQAAYKLTSVDSWSPTEKWSHILRQDHAAYLTMLIRLLTIPHLTLSPEVTNTLTERMHKKMADFEDMNQVNKIKAGDCNQRFLAKRYTLLVDVHKDSHHGSLSKKEPIYFDAEFDDTPYDLLKPLEEEFANTTAKPTEFEEFVAHNLIDRHNYVPKMAQEVAETMVSRKRRVQEGHYAILESSSSSHPPFYYRRTHDDKWVLDKTVDATTFVDTPTLFCNMDKICMRDASAPICQNPEDAQLRLRYLEQRRTLREMQTRMTKSAFQTAKQLEDEANRIRQCLKRRAILQFVDLHRFDEYHQALGQQQHHPSMDNPTRERIESPYKALRNRILGYSDTVRRNQRILDFVVRHCREALGTES
ncbi:hypothetical protein EBR57_09370, partial [bacterium]|nr:hypothetical protein [bacterium]